MNDINDNDMEEIDKTGVGNSNPDGEISGKIIFMYGLPGSGKTTLCDEAKKIKPDWHMVNAHQYTNIFIKTFIPRLLEKHLPHEFKYFRNNVIGEKRRFVIQECDLSLESLNSFIKKEHLETWNYNSYQKLVKTILTLRQYLKEKKLHTKKLCQRQSYIEIFKNSPRFGRNKVTIIEFNISPEMVASMISDANVFHDKATHLQQVPFKSLLVYSPLSTILQRNKDNKQYKIGALSFRLLNDIFNFFAPVPTENQENYTCIDTLKRQDILSLISSVTHEQFEKYQERFEKLNYSFDEMKNYFLKFSNLNEKEQLNITNRFRADAIIDTRKTVDDSTNKLIEIIEGF